MLPEAISFRHIFALIRFYYHINPEDLDMDTYVKLLSELVWLSKIGVLNVKLS